MSTTINPAITEKIQLLFGDDLNSCQKTSLLNELRSENPLVAQHVDMTLVSEIQRIRKGLEAARVNLQELEEVLNKAQSPPWHPAVFGHPVESGNELRYLVWLGGRSLIVDVASEVDPLVLSPGDEIYLSNEMTTIIGVSLEAPLRIGQTAEFLRVLDGTRVLIQHHRGDQVIVEAVGDLAADLPDLEKGTLLRWDPSCWMAFEAVPKDEEKPYLLAEVPDADASQIGGQSAAFKSLMDALTSCLLEPVKSTEYGLSDHPTVLMIGPPGCGKTLMVRAAAAEIMRQSGRTCHFAVVKPAEWESEWVGRTEHNIRDCFSSLAELTANGDYAVLFLDEVDAIGQARSSSFVGVHNNKFVAALLAEIDGFQARKNVAIVGATNLKSLVDPALLERMSDVEIPVARPDMQGARDIFAIHLPEALPFSPNGDAAGKTRESLIELATARLYSPNADNDLCRIRFRDGKTRVIKAHELASGRLMRQICDQAKRLAFHRDNARGDRGIRAEDIHEATSAAIDRLASTLTPRNARHYLADLPQDVDVVSIESLRPKVKRSHRYLRNPNE